MTPYLAKISAAQGHNRGVTALDSPAFSKSQLVAMGGLPVIPQWTQSNRLTTASKSLLRKIIYPGITPSLASG
jgi:hypothetical protein